MSRLAHHSFPVVALALAGCAGLFPEVVPEAKGDFKPTGSLQMQALGASFDSARVISPSIAVSRRTDGSWGGRFALAGSGDVQAIDVSVAGDRVSGVNFVMVRDQPSPGLTVISGSFKGKTFRFELSRDQFGVHTTRRGVTLGNREERADGSVSYGPEQNLVLTGDAAKLDPVPWPQMGFALVAAFY